MTFLSIDHEHPLSIPLAPCQLKFLIEAINFFTNCVEVEALENIIVVDILKLFKRNILARYIIHQSTMMDNTIKFKNGNLNKLLEDLRVKKHFMSVEHPQTKGKAEVETRALL